MCMMCMTLAPHVLDPEIKDRGTSAGVMHAMDHSGHDAQAMPASAPHAEGESLLDILKRRYALGEINREQFEEMRRVLNLGATEAGTEHAGH